MNRKAITTEAALITVIVFSMVMVIAAVLAAALFSVGKSQFTEAQCRASLLLTRAVDKPQWCAVKIDNPVPIQCNRDFVTATKTTVTRDGKDVTTAYTALCPAPDGTASCLSANVVAEEMRTCWREFFEGDTPVLQQLEVNDFNIFKSSNQRACFVCAEVTLKDDDVADLNKYLKGQKITVANQQVSYYDYLTSPKAYCNPAMKKTEKPDPNAPSVANCYEGIAQQGGDYPNIDHKTLPAGTYAVVFMRQGVTSCTGTTLPAESKITQTVQVIPAKDIAAQCDLVTV